MRAASETLTGASATVPETLCGASVIARAPGRVNIIGDHVDYCGGLVLPMALPHSCFAGVFRRHAPAGYCRVSSTSTDDPVDFRVTRAVAPGEACPIGSWASYMIGALAELADVCDLSKLSGCEIRVHSEVPLGAGLSSSAALEVSVALAGASAMGCEVSGLDLARRCQRAEHRFAGMPCGLMDQAASVLGEEGHAILLDCATETPRMIAMPDSASFVIVNSGVKHALADGEYAKRKAMCAAAATTLGVEHLAHAHRSSAAALASGQREAAEHVIGETARVQQACDAFQTGDLRTVGELMLASHASLRDVYHVSCTELDALVERLQVLPGVHGVRMTGGGFGGSVVALVDRGREADIADAAESCRDVCPDLSVIEAVPSNGATVLRLPHAE